jgi:hypothetical protein
LEVTAIRKLLLNTFREDDGLNIRKILGVVGFLVCIVTIFHPGIDANQYDGLLAMVFGLLTVEAITNKSEGSKTHDEADKKHQGEQRAAVDSGHDTVRNMRRRGKPPSGDKHGG